MVTKTRKPKEDKALKMLADNMVMMPIGLLKKYPKNPRIGNLEGIKESIRENGFAKIILVQKGTMYVLDGNHTYQAAQEMGYQEIPCAILDIDDKTAARIVLAANRLNDMATYDNDLLAEVLKALGTPVGTGYTDEDYTALVSAINTDSVELPSMNSDDPVFGGLDSPTDLGLPGEDDDTEGVLESSAEELKGGFALKSIDEILYEGAGYWGIPALRPDMLMLPEEVPDNLMAWAGSATKDWPDPDQWWLYNVGVDSTSGMNDVSKMIISFYTWDHYFESWWIYPDRWVSKLLNSKIKYAITPDFSMWSAKPMVESLHNLYRNRWLGRYFQEAGIKVIPNIGWPYDKQSFYDKHIRATLPKVLPVVAMQLQTVDEKLDRAEWDSLKKMVKHVIETCDADLTLVYAGKQGMQLVNELNLTHKIMVIPFRTEALAAQASKRAKKKTI